MLVGSVGYIISLGATAWTFYQQGSDFSQTGSLVVLFSLLVFIASHAFGQGAVIWVFISEIFPNNVRARGQALGSFTHWFMAAAVSWTFPVFAEVSGGHVFTFYAVCMVGQLISKRLFSSGLGTALGSGRPRVSARESGSPKRKWMLP